jgi:hypothetical protein
MPASAGRVEDPEEDAQTGDRSGFVSPSRAASDGAPAVSEEAARGQSRASRGEKRQHRSGPRSESVPPIRQRLSTEPADIWGRHEARRAASTRTSWDGRAQPAGGRLLPPRADRSAVRETLDALDDEAWPDAGPGSPGRSSGDDAPTRYAGLRAAGGSSRTGAGLPRLGENSAAGNRRTAQGASSQGPRSRLAFVNGGGVAALRAGPSAGAAFDELAPGDALRVSTGAVSALLGPVRAALLRVEGR